MKAYKTLAEWYIAAGATEPLADIVQWVADEYENWPEGKDYTIRYYGPVEVDQVVGFPAAATYIARVIEYGYLEELAEWGTSMTSQLETQWVYDVTTLVTGVGISTVERWMPQADRPVRNYTKDELPAVWCHASVTDASAHSCGYIQADYDIEWGVIVEDGNAQEALLKLNDIRDEIVKLFRSGDYQGSTAFMGALDGQVHFDNFDMGDVEPLGKTPSRIWALNKMTARVTLPDPSMES